jgi:hypothetical protein
MQLDLIGRLTTNTRLAEENALLPLFEAIINSIHAIQDSKRQGGRIAVRVMRNMVQSLLNDAKMKVSRDIKDFGIEDNGIGFTSDNFQSFNTADSQIKQARGAKGVGRFMWLKPFEGVFVESRYAESQTRMHRTFWFKLTKEGVVEPTV